MDWARRVREAPDHELVFVLRQCMVASEYTVRHLRWDEIPQLDPRNFRGGIRPHDGHADSENSNLVVGGESDLAASLNINNSGIRRQQRNSQTGQDLARHGVNEPKGVGVLFLPDSTVGESSTDPSSTSPNELGAGLNSTRDLTFYTCPNTPSTPNSSNPQLLSQSHSPSYTSPSSSSCLGHDTSGTTLDYPSGSNSHNADNKVEPHSSNHSREPCQHQHSPSHQESSSSSTQRPQASSSPSSSSSSSMVSPSQPSSSNSSSLSSSLPSSAYSGTNYYGTWHGSSKSSPSRRISGGAGARDSSIGSSNSGDCYDHGVPRHQRQHSTASQASALGTRDKDDSPSHRPLMERSNSSSYLVRRQLEMPESVAQVDNDLLCSGVAILPGCIDEEGRHLVYIFTCSSLWHDRRVSSQELARLLMYYYTVPRRKCSYVGMAVVADIRGSTTSTINILLEALYLFQDNVEEPVSIVHLFADKSTQSLVIKSPLYDAKATMNLKIVLSFDHLQQYISPDQIPTVLDGECPYNHESWVRFRKKLEPFMTSCRAVACRLVDTMQKISSCEQMPQSVAESSEMIQAHEHLVRDAFEDERLLTLQSDGPAIISALRREEESFAHSEDYRFAMEQATDLHTHLQDSIARLARLADTHMTKLHNCLQLREYEEECHKVINWLAQDGGTILQKHAATADNLRAVRHQQKDFEKFYYSAMSYIEKGNDLLEEASMLSQCGNFSEATGYKDLAKTLKRQLQTFTGQLEEARERIEGTAKCYHLLDKSYEWALEAMKYVSSMKMEHSTTAEGLDKLLRSLNIYLSEHPAISEESFATMLEAAQRLHNDKLLEQCRVAKARCQETHQLLQLRQTTLRRARNQMEVEQALKEGGASQDSREESKSTSVFDVHEMVRPIDHISQDISSDYRDFAHSSLDAADHSSCMFSSPSSYSKSMSGNDSTVSKTPIDSSTHKEGGDGVGRGPLWEPQDASTPASFANWQGAGDGAKGPRKIGFQPDLSPSHSLNVSSGASPQFRSPAEPSSPYSSASSNTSSNSSPVKAPLSSSLSLPIPSSSSPTHSSSTMELPLSPTLSSAETPRARLYHPSSSSISRLYNSSPTRISPGSNVPCAAKLALGRTISQPGPPRSVHSLPAGVAPSTRPHKKILKRASTAPVPMLTSPILEEETGQFGHPAGIAEEEGNGNGNGSNGGGREDRSAKSISMITGSSESLPSMPEEEEEEEGDLDMSPRHQERNSSIKDWTPVPVNTHLHRSARGTPTGPMADLRLSEAEMKSRRTISLIMSEMIQTERDYVRALQFISDHYIPELQREDVPQMLRGKRTVIFGNLEKILQFHSHYFLKQLESCQNQPFLVGQYFLQHETMFYLYALYNKNKPKSDTLMIEYGKEFFRQKQLELGDKMDLSSYLLKPVQRMGKYALLLKQLLKECAETELEYPELKAAEEMVKFQLRHGNDLLAMDSLRDCDVNLQEQGRLLRQEEFLVFQGRKKCIRRIFLFEDLILFSKTRRGRQGQHDIYVYKTSFKTADIGMTENYGNSEYKFEIWFRRRSVGENYVLQAPSTEVKKAWVKDISRLLWRQAIRNRESRINELATMGIGNKPCMDIKPSEDNIQDRSINVSLSHVPGRTRNSIAVSSFDYLRNGNKRPHSIISVSSTSSSGSSQSSYGLLGSLNLAFDPLDSPRMNRRSFLSNESGIVTDIETSGGDLGSENRGPTTPRRNSQGSTPAPLSSMRSYFDVMKSRVLKQKYSDQVYTDV